MIESCTGVRKLSRHAREPTIRGGHALLHNKTRSKNTEFQLVKSVLIEVVFFF